MRQSLRLFSKCEDPFFNFITKSHHTNSSFTYAVVRLSSKKILRKKCTLVTQLPQAYLNAKDTEIPYSLRLCPFYIKIEIFCPSKRSRNF